MACGSRARMPPMISRLMPLPMPYSSICSPSHIRKIVPAVAVSTQINCQENCRPLSALAGSLRKWWSMFLPPRRQVADVDPALAQAEEHGGVAGIFVDLLAARFAFLLQLFQRRIDAAQKLEDDRGRDVGHDAQAEDRGLAQIRGAEGGDVIDDAAARRVLLPIAAWLKTGSGMCEPMRKTASSASVKKIFVRSSGIVKMTRIFSHMACSAFRVQLQLRDRMGLDGTMRLMGLGPSIS